MEVIDALYNVVMSIPNFFLGALQVFFDAFNHIIEILPNPDPFPAMIDGMETTSPSTQAVSTAVWWLDTAYDLMWFHDIVVAWAGMMVVAIFVILIIKIVMTILSMRGL